MTARRLRVLIAVVAAVAAAGLSAGRPAVSDETEPQSPPPAEDAAVWLQQAPWTLTATSETGSERTDTLQFRDRSMSSAALAEQGFPESTYTVSVDSEGVPVWEAMQISATHGVALWRGELRDGAMSGSLITQPLDGGTEEWTFVGHQVGHQ